MIAGLEPPDTGTLAVQRGVTIEYLSQEPVFAPGLTAYQAVEQSLTSWRSAMDRYQTIAEKIALEGHASAHLSAEQSAAAEQIERLGGWDPSHRINTFLDRLGVSALQTPIEQMSGGERRRVALARVLASAPDLAILDEPTNHLDPDTVEWLEDYLVESFAGAILLVTHDRYVLDRVVTRIIEIDHGNATTFEGNYSGYLRIRAERAALEAKEEATRQNTLRIERDWLSRQAPARTTKQKARIDRAIELEAQAKAVRDSKRFDGSANFEAANVRGSKRLIEAEGLSKSIGDKLLFSDLSLILLRGERLGILGPNGAGKTTLVKVLLNELVPDAGTVTHATSAACKYLDQNRSELDDTQLVIEAVTDGGDRVRVGDKWMRVEAYLERFMFGPDKHRQRVEALSGGERARLSLARMLRGEANVLVLDEPTNDLDLPTLAVLEDLLISFEGSVIVITHDRAFLDRVATHVLAFEGDGKVTRYAGGYEDYRAQKALTEQRAKEARTEQPVVTSAAPASTGSTESKKSGKKAALTWGEQRELEALPTQIDDAEKRLAAATKTLEDPALYSKGAAILTAAQHEHDQAQKSVEQLMQRWEILERKKAESA
jgi:ATP-binding cassette subfamily F protein uup